MRWISRWIFVKNAVKCGELFFFTAFTAIIAFLTKNHRIHRISYKNLPKNLDPGTWSLCLYTYQKTMADLIKTSGLFHLLKICGYNWEAQNLVQIWVSFSIALRKQIVTYLQLCRVLVLFCFTDCKEGISVVWKRNILSAQTNIQLVHNKLCFKKE